MLDSHAMRIAYRTRDSGSIRRVVARRSASAHVLLCTRYGVQKSSAFVGGGRLLKSTLKLPFAAARMAVEPSARDLEGLRARAAGILGFWIGTVRYRILRRTPHPRLGVGLQWNSGPDDEEPELLR
ncbi:hypothetical protein GCM10023159_08810 [Brevibacterium yomogidense]